MLRETARRALLMLPCGRTLQLSTGAENGRLNQRSNEYPRLRSIARPHPRTPLLDFN
jgi:hypothetical protein